MKLATWNVNSLRARMGWVEEWLRTREPDVLVMQETKLADDDFPTKRFLELGYESVHHGNGRWNGVAIVSRVGIANERGGFHDDEGPVEERRIISADCGGIHVVGVYVPNGRTVPSEHYDAKLVWLGRLADELVATTAPERDVVVCGDFNVAPADDDVWDITHFVGMTHVTEPERDGVQKLVSWGLVDAMRIIHPEGPGPFSWWDYRAGAFHKGMGMRIDLALISRSLADRLVDAQVDRDARKVFGAHKPSDHAPVVLEFSEVPSPPT
jgi:exodeoxyribonuclease-3